MRSLFRRPPSSDDFDGCLDLLLCLRIYLLGLSVPLLCLFCGYFFFLFLDVLLMGLRQLHALVQLVQDAGSDIIWMCQSAVLLALEE